MHVCAQVCPAVVKDAHHAQISGQTDVLCCCMDCVSHIKVCACIHVDVCCDMYLYNLAACRIQLQHFPLPSLLDVPEDASIVCMVRTTLEDPVLTSPCLDKRLQMAYATAWFLAEPG